MSDSSAVRVHDLVDVAKGIDAPYQPVSLERLPTMEVALLVCGDAKTWHHPIDQDELLVVIEGIIAVDGPSGSHVADEGDALLLPAGGVYRVSSGMRSVALLFQGLEPQDEANGHHRSPEAITPPATQIGFAKSVHEAPHFDWLGAGAVRGFQASATRLSGQSQSYELPKGALVALNYRGVLDTEIDGEESDLIGGQLLVVPAGHRVKLRSERGATLLVLVPTGAPLPQAASASQGGPSETA